MGMLLIGPVGHIGVGWPEVTDTDDTTLEYKGFRLIARARRGPVGWVGELRIVLHPVDSPLQGFIPIGRFHTDPQTAIQQALLEGMLRVERGEVIAL